MTEDKSCAVPISDAPFVDGAPRICSLCTADLCLRMQVLNLALGNTDEMQCLSCLAKDNDQAPAETLNHLMPYISQRDCFRKQWERYTCVEQCPKPHGCEPDICFKLHTD